ncbi:hypothetical protein [uncultured Algibacter sp.]|uniref:hypothetical protein n=1 Tax=uncultured Algibacter sp. TaxID=298659 RepID=UPI002622A6A0|nr:hypothetical protein [uncultured Algibacter sp.]
MLLANYIHRLLTGFVLLLTLLSFSGFAPASTNYQKPITELLVEKPQTDKKLITFSKVSLNTLKKHVFNKYIVFNFKCLVSALNFDLTVRFKSQNETVLKLVNFHNILEQNLIAHQHSSNLPDRFIE